MCKLLLRIVAISLLALKASVSAGDAETGKRTPVTGQAKETWAGLNLSGLELTLRSETEIRWYLFHSDGTVSATVGKKKSYMAGPLWYWRISGQWLQILDDDGKLLYQMLLQKVGKDELSI